MKRIVIIATVLLGLVGLTACNKTEGDPDVIVESKSGNVTKEMFYEELKKLQGSDQVLKDLMTYVILEDKYKVTDEDVERELGFFKAQIGENFDELLEIQNVTIDELKQEIKKSLLNEAIITEGHTITDEAIKEYYEKMKLQLTARHILVKEEELAKEIKAKLDGGGDFVDLAKEYSIDGTAKDGGDLGSFTAGKWIPEFEDAVFALQVGEISDLVQSKYGYHIIELTDKKVREDEEVGSLDKNWIEIRRTLIERVVDPVEAKDKLNNIFDDAKVKVNIKQFEDLFKQEKEDEDDKESDKDGEKEDDNKSDNE